MSDSHEHDHSHDHEKTFVPDEELSLGFYGVAERAVRDARKDDDDATMTTRRRRRSRD